MTLAPHPRSTAADLLRLLAAWLAAIVLVQGIAAALALGHGPLHRHLVVAAPDHHHHDGAERHHHALDAGVLTLAAADPAPDEAAFALVAALALLAFAVARLAPDTRRHVWRAAPAWAWLPTLTAPPRRPPRRA
jgi:hypothetical protein